MATHTIWQIHNLHNCMIHKDTMLKFCRLFDLAKYLGHTLTFQRMGYGRELVAPTLNFGTPFILKTNRARKLKFGVLVGICRYYSSMQKIVC